MSKNKKRPEVAASNEIQSEVPVDSVSHAPWNPRTAEELKPNHPAMASLIDSVRALGVVQPIAVWRGPEVAEILGDGKNAMCIAGNRRLEAARAVGLKVIPVHVFDRLTEETARAITRAENECRFGVTPMMDAKLVKSMLDIGRSQAEIAALVGVSEATICRRAKLLDLDDSVIEAIGDADLDARALEKIAAFPAELQKQAAKRIADRVQGGRTVTPAAVDNLFAELTRKIDKDLWIFRGPGGEGRRSTCLACPNLSGNQPELFDAVVDTHGESDSSVGKGRGEYGRCLCAKCYKRMEVEAKEDIIAAEVAATSDGLGAERVVPVECSWNEPFKSMSAKKRAGKKICAYAYWSSWRNEAEIRWGYAPEKYEEQAREEKKNAAAEAVERKRIEKLIENAVGIVDRYLFGESAEQCVRDVDFCCETLKLFPVDFVRRLAAEGLANLFENEYYECMAKDVRRFAREVPEIKTLLSAEEFEAIGGNSND